jgi:hypothetical protein
LVENVLIQDGTFHLLGKKSGIHCKRRLLRMSKHRKFSVGTGQGIGS